MNYKKFVLKLYLPMQIFIVIVIFLLLIIVEYNYTDRGLNTKEYLLTKEVDIFFAGDSRAQRQLNPLIAETITNKYNFANIAVDSGDVVMLEYLIKTNKEYFKDKQIILSISPNQINDGAKDIGYFSNAMLSKLPLNQKLILMKESPELIINYYKNGIKNLLPIRRDKFASTKGFYPTTGNYKLTDKLVIETHPWYKNWYINGIKYNIVKNSLKYIKQNVKKLYVFSTSYAPSYYIKNKDILNEKENSFKNSMLYLTKNLEIKYKYYDFYEIGFEDKYFFDNAHLNSDGAQKFTQIILSDFLK